MKLRSKTKYAPLKMHGQEYVVGIFDKLEKALAFDSDEINAIVKDLGVLKLLFKNKMEQKAPPYLKLVTHKIATH